MYYHFGEPWAEGSVNGVRGLYLVDTGAAMSVLDMETARHAGVVPVGTQQVITTTGEAVLARGWVERIEFAGQRHQQRQVSIQDLTAFRAPAGHRQAGLIGSDFLLGYTIAFEPLNQVLELSPKEGPLLPGLRSHPMFLSNGVPMIEVRFGNELGPVWAKLDTGSGYADERHVYVEVTDTIARRLLGPGLDGPAAETVTVMSLSGTQDLRIFEYGPVRILGRTFNPVRLVVHEHNGGLFAQDDRVLISGSLLGRFSRFEVDYPRRTIWVRD